MKCQTVTALLAVFLCSVAGCSATENSRAVIDRSGLAKFEPPAGKVIVFVGQDNESVGGNAKYKNGYVDTIGIPGGITHYVGMGADRTNQFKDVYDDTKVDGLNTESRWGAGPMCMKYYVDSPVLKPCVMHLSISMTNNNEDKVGDGTHDALIEELVQFLKDYNETPFLLRIGYEFNGPWNKYDPVNFKKAFRRIVDKLREAKVTNFATVMASSSYNTAYEKWEAYYPGDEYVDWVGYSYWQWKEPKTGVCDSLEFARDKGKPVFIAEITPRKHFFTQEDGKELWEDWFIPFFEHIENNIDVVKAISYINANWEAQPMWKGGQWGDTRIQTDEYIKTQWLEKLNEPRFINAADKPFDWIGFGPKGGE